MTALMRETVPLYWGSSSSSFTQSISSETQMCSVGEKALRSSKAASARDHRRGLRQANSLVPQILQKTRSSVSEEA